MEFKLLLQIGGVILFLIFLLSLFQCYDPNQLCRKTVEHYEERIGGKMSKDDNYRDLYDSEFVDIYELVYRDETDTKNVVDVMKSKCLDNIQDSSKLNIMIGGCGVNKTGSYLKKSYDKVTCVDLSENMLMKAQQLHPECKYIHGDLRNKNLFKKGEFSHILLDERLLNYHNKKDMSQIIDNCNFWIAEQGFLITPIYGNEKLGVASRYYSMNYHDDKGNLHGFTYINDFSHDCYYIKDMPENEQKEKSNKKESEVVKEVDSDVDYIYNFFDKIVLDDGRKRIKKFEFYFYPKDEIYTIIVRRHFKIFYVEPYKIGKQVMGGYDVVVFRKERSQLSVEEIQEKYENGKKE